MINNNHSVCYICASNTNIQDITSIAAILQYSFSSVGSNCLNFLFRTITTTTTPVTTAASTMITMTTTTVATATTVLPINAASDLKKLN